MLEGFGGRGRSVLYIATYICSFIYLDAGSTHGSEDWTDLVDRGGLKHVSDTVYMMFYEMEMEVRSHIRDNCASEVKTVKNEVTQAMKQNEDVLFYWSIVSANWKSEEASAVLLDMIMEVWVTMRGFSYAGAFIEQYKQKNKKCTQKSKGLRKTLISSNSASAE